MNLAMMLRHAVREGGANPDFNTQLGNIIEQCQGANMPKASIKAAMKGADKSKASSYALYEARGPGGSSLLIEILTDNNTRSHQEIKHILNKNGGALSDGARHSFQWKGVVVLVGEVPLDRALGLAIEPRTVSLLLFQFLCDVTSLRSVREALQALGVQTLSAGPEFVACSSVQLSDSELEAASKLLELLNDCHDVIRVYDNIQPLN
ncbi:Translational activator of cytochrome c oxidase 1 [Acipenser ruthenus]|uniref:Translational activator of cytochrome c oxidase 1 n=1 Tax=Acipenser ruthenus TaxID=7906 RepID=A0A444UBN1_ACIRT|nr:Translational activator of cytochrome c oxidase 1 [Acipenser ruthenus]